MKAQLFAFIDTETTGLDVERHELIEIAGMIVRIENPTDVSSYEIIDQFAYKIKPDRISDADPVALRVNRYDPSKWIEALSLRDAIEKVMRTAEGSVMVAHNVAFDSAFIEKACKITGVPNTMHYHKLDTISMAYALLKNNEDVDHLSLRALCKHFGIEQNVEHEALADVRSMFELYKKLMSL